MVNYIDIPEYLISPFETLRDSTMCHEFLLTSSSQNATQDFLQNESITALLEKTEAFDSAICRQEISANVPEKKPTIGNHGFRNSTNQGHTENRLFGGRLWPMKHPVHIDF